MIFSQILVACDIDISDFRYGLPESCFQLAQESRLPKWFELPKGYSRNEVDLALCYYLPPFMESRVIVKLKSHSTGRVLLKVTGSKRYHPDSEKRGIKNYPVFSIITVDGINEIIEHRQLGNIVNIADDPQLIEAIKQPIATN